LPPTALSHFEQREQELLALNQELEQKKAQALAEASSAVRGAASSPLYSRPHTPAEIVAAAVPASSQLGMTPLEASGEAAPLLSAAAAATDAPSLFRPLTGGSASALPDSGSEALQTTIRFQNARIVALQEELDKTIAELAKRDSEAQQFQRDLKQALDESKRLQSSGASAQQKEEKLKKELAGVQELLKAERAEKAELIKVKDQIELQHKKSEAESSTKEARLNRLTEENDKLKVALREATSQDKDRAVADRRETDRLTGEVRKLERQRQELVNAFKKQMKLIEVLKRQRAHMEAARVLSFTEDEFIRILELGDKLGE